MCGTNPDSWPVSQGGDGRLVARAIQRTARTAG